MNISELSAPVKFFVNILDAKGDESYQEMTASRLHRDKYKLENGVYRVLQLRDERPCLIMLQDGEGNDIGDEVNGYSEKERRKGKSLAAIITGCSHRFHYKNDEYLNNLTTNFEAR